MRWILNNAALAILFSGSCWGQLLRPEEALDRYLVKSSDPLAKWQNAVFAVQIDAVLPKLGKEGRMSGFKLISQTGQVIYRGLRFTGDNVVKTAVIARFLAKDTEPQDTAGDMGITRQNYSFRYDKIAAYNEVSAYVFRLKARRKQVGLFDGELWIDANTAAPLRLWGDFVKSPSIFVRSVRFVQDCQMGGECFQPLRLLVSVQTRLAGHAEMAVWLHAVEGEPAVPEPVPGSSMSAPGTTGSGQISIH
jgi:hypothetical protein